MATGASTAPLSNGTHSAIKPIQLAVTLPHSPGTKIHLHLTVLATSLVLFLANTSTEAGPGSASLGSFVYAMPDVSACQPLIC